MEQVHHATSIGISVETQMMTNYVTSESSSDVGVPPTAPTRPVVVNVEMGMPRRNTNGME